MSQVRRLRVGDEDASGRSEGRNAGLSGGAASENREGAKDGAKDVTPATGGNGVCCSCPSVALVVSNRYFSGCGGAWRVRAAGLALFFFFSFFFPGEAESRSIKSRNSNYLD